MTAAQMTQTTGESWAVRLLKLLVVLVLMVMGNTQAALAPLSMTLFYG